MLRTELGNTVSVEQQQYNTIRVIQMVSLVLSRNKLQNQEHQNRKANGHDSETTRIYHRTSVHPGSGPEPTNAIN